MPTLLPFKLSSFFFFNDTATTEIYTLSLHDALPISQHCMHASLPTSSFRGCTKIAIVASPSSTCSPTGVNRTRARCGPDRKSTRLNSSHSQISYAVFCLKKKTKIEHDQVKNITRRGR